MDYRKIISKSINNVLTNTNFVELGEKYQGKVRDCYFKSDYSYLITTDRLSAFDRILTSIPFKGQVVTELSVENFRLTADIVKNHLIDHPDPNVMVVHRAEMLPVEVVVRGYLAGSAIVDYQAGKPISGVNLPVGLVPYAEFSEPIITPSTKAPQGEHDLPISEQEIISSGLVESKLWSELREKAIALFRRGQEIALKRGLILVDTKYEFGTLNGELILADEIHTLDSSRFWEFDSYQNTLTTGVRPKMLDKQNVREWLLKQGFKGDGPVPTITDDYRSSVAELYLNSYHRLTGKDLQINPEPVLTRIAKNLKLNV